MDEETARKLAWKILGEVEEMMNEDGVAVSSGESHQGVKVRAFFEDREYHALEETIVGILLSPAAIEPVMSLQPVDGHDW